MYYSTGRSPHLPKVGAAVEADELTAMALIERGFISKTMIAEKKVKVVVYFDKSGKEYTEEEVLAMDKRTALYKEIMEQKNK